MYTKGIAIAGSTIADVGYLIDQYPQRGNLTWIYDPVFHTGGINNIMIDLARLDPQLPLKACGVVGDDEQGRLIFDTLAEYDNIDTSNITVRGRTAVTYAMTEKGSKERTFFYDPGTSLDFHRDDIDFERLDADFFLLEYLLLLGHLDEPDAQYGTKAGEVLCRAQERGMKTVIDMVSEESDRYQTVVCPTLKYVDYYISNEVEASGVLGYSIYDTGGIKEDLVWPALAKIRELGVSEWVIVHSPTGAYGLHCRTGEQVQVASCKLPPGYIKGTTGAGDAFGAGVLYGAYHGMGLSEALAAGVRCAAYSLGAEDSNSGVIQFSEMKDI